MRLALTHAYSWPDVRRGGERVLHELSRALVRRGHEVTVFTTGSPPGRSVEHGTTFIRFQRKYDNDPDHEIYFSKLVFLALLRRRFHCVHSFGPHDAVGSIRASRATRHRTVYTNLGIPLRAWWDGLPAREDHERVVREVDVYGCLSRFALEALARDYGRTGVITPGGVDVSEFEPAACREQQPTVLFSGALNESRKGLPALLEAFALLLKTEPTARLWLSGPGSAEDALSGVSARIRDRIDVLPIGDPREQSSRYGRAWVTAVPSIHEAFGLVVLESFACGTPVAASDGWAFPELVTAGSTGALCDPADPGSIAAALAEAIALCARAETVDACRGAAEPYDWETGIVPQLEKVYSKR